MDARLLASYDQGPGNPAETVPSRAVNAGGPVAYMIEEPVRDAIGGSPRQGRRLADKVLAAFHHACDVNDFETAEQLLVALEVMLTRRPFAADAGRRRAMESLVMAHERLWRLRHPLSAE